MVVVNDAYWANRMQNLEESLLDTGYEYVKNLDTQYDLAIKTLESDMATWYQRFATDNKVTLAEAQKMLSAKELKEFQWSVDEYIKYGQENAVSQAWLKQLKNASARVHISRLDSLKIQLQQQAEALHGAQAEALGSSLGTLYESSYNHTAYELQKGTGVGWSLQGLDDSAISKVLSRPWTTDMQTFRDRCWTNKDALVRSVNTQLTQMFMRGTAPDKAISAISKEFGVSKRKAGRLVMTESAAFANEARKDCFNDLGVEEYIIVETLDGETCSLCAQLDGKIFPMSDYAVGVTAPPFHPWCRGTTAPYFEDLEGLGDRAAKDEDGKTYDVPKDMTYTGWEAYNKAVAKEPRITTAITEITEKTGGSLFGAEYRLKTPSSFSRKINSDSKDLRVKTGMARNEAALYAAEHTYDAVRYTNISKSDDFLSNYNNVVYNLEKAGYNVSRVKNSMADASASYRGVNTVITTQDGYHFELQFHTPESMTLKDKVHPLYEEWRLDTTTAARKAEFDQEMKALSSAFVAPSGADKITPFNDLR